MLDAEQEQTYSEAVTPAAQAGRVGIVRRRLLPTGALLIGLLAAGCGVPLAPQYLTATASSGGSVLQEPVSDSAKLASSLPAAAIGVESPAASPRLTATPLATVAPLQMTVTPGPAGTAAAGLTALGLADDTPTASPSTPLTPAAMSAASETPPASASPSPTQTPSPTATPTPDISPASVVDLVNDVRARNGRTRLASESSLAAAAAAYARLMAESNYFGHTGPDGSTAETRLLAAGYSGRFDGEALAAGQTSAQEVVNVWLNSAPHRAILLSATATEIGVGHYYKQGNIYGHYWVLVVGSR